MSICGVYKIKNKVTGECYVGSSVNVMRRWKEHKRPFVHRKCPNSKMYQDMDKLGVESFELEILCECNKGELRDMEQWYIDWEKPEYNDRRAFGQNIRKYRVYQKTYQKAYHSQLCNYNGEVLTLKALEMRFQRKGIPQPTAEAKKYLIAF